MRTRQHLQRLVAAFGALAAVFAGWDGLPFGLRIAGSGLAMVAAGTLLPLEKKYLQLSVRNSQNAFDAQTDCSEWRPSLGH
jgi:hypothetical protein